MHFQLIEKEKAARPGLWQGLWLAALLGALLSMVDSLAYFWAVLPGVGLVIGVGFLPRKRQRILGAVSFGLCLIWLAFRLVPIGDGLGFLANRLFTLSEEGQDFCYTHFDVAGNAPAESLVFVSCVLGALCLLLGGGVNLVLTLLTGLMIAYFGVAPSIVWLSILIATAFANGLPKHKRWLPAILIAAFVAVTAMSVQTVAPEPNVKITALAEKMWETFMPPTPEEPEPLPTEPSDAPELPDIEDMLETMETIELPEGFVPTKPQMEIPATVLTPVAPPKEPPQKDTKQIPIVPILSAVLAVSAVGAVWLMIAAQKRKKNRLAMYAENKAAAIRGMYLYAKLWRKLNAFAGEIPEEVEAIWLEAAYSDHEMTDAQRDEMRAFVETSARKAWKNLNWWQRFVVYFCRAL